MANDTSNKVANQTGAAKDDIFTSAATGLTKNKLLANLNVLDNDPGSAKLYSLIQSTAGLAANATTPVQDNITLPSGAKIKMNADGTVSYDASGLYAKDSLKYLAEGESFVDTFVYVIRMANGALSTAKVTVNIGGVNEAPTLAAVNGVPVINDTAAWDTPAPVGGSLSGSDINHNTVFSYSLANGAASQTNQYGTLNVNAKTGEYSFTADPVYLNGLKNGENATATFSVIVKDEHGAASNAVTLSFKLVGADDTSSIDGNGNGAVVEDGTLTASGKLTVHDGDAGEAVFQTPATLAGTYGDFTFNKATGEWSYALRNGAANVQALKGGEKVFDEITVTSKDGGASAKLHVDITGTNDAAVVTGDTQAALQEDGPSAKATGKLNISDADAGESSFQAPASAALHGSYGDFTFDAATGAWTYTLRNGDANVQALNAGKVVTDNLTVTSLDGGTSTTLQVTITGTNDAAAIAGDSSGALVEDGVNHASGTLTVTDVDDGEAVFQAPTTLHGTYGDFTFDSATGAWAYDLRNGDANVQALRGGEKVADELTVTSADGSASKTLHIDITGTNDAAHISGNGDGAVAEDGQQTAGGTLAVTDIDTGEAVFQPVSNAALHGVYGDFTFDQDSGAWTYTLRNGDANVQALREGEKVADELTVTSSDGTDSKTIHVDITGTNDAATIAGDDSGAVVEDGKLDASGKLTVSDVDTGEAVFKAVDGAALHGTYGDFSFDSATGAWSYHLRNGDANVQALAAGDKVADELTVTSSDGTASHTLHVDITGTNDEATINGNGTGAVAEDGTAATGGTVTVADVDHDQAVFKGVDPAALKGSYGDFTFDSATGAWTYTLRNNDANVQALQGGEKVADELTVTSFDGTASKTLHVDITGTNDAATISGNSSGAVVEDGQLSAGGTLTVSDVDHGEAVFKAVASSALKGTYGDFTFDSTSGAWTYALRNGDANVQALTAGQKVADELIVASLDGTDSRTLHVDITGTNDTASITGNATGSVTEDGTLAASGKLTVSDADTGEAVFKNVDAAALHGTYGDFSFDSATGAWSYLLRNGDANVQALKQGEVVADELTVTSADGTATKTVHVDVNGSNDVPVITGTTKGAVVEDGTLSASGKLNITDVDAGQSSFTAPASAALHGTYGDFSFDSGSGAWSYLLRNGDAIVQALKGGQVVFDELVVTSLDGSASKTLHVDVTGTNDKAVIGGANTGSVQEDTTLSTSGTLTITDVDTGEAAFQAPAASALTGTYGNFTFNAGSGAWTYNLRNADANVQALVTGQTVTDKLVVTSLDGSTSGTITVNVAGLDEPNPVKIWMVNQGQSDNNNRVIFDGFDFNDIIDYSNNYVYVGHSITVYNGQASSAETFTFNNGNKVSTVTVILVGYTDFTHAQLSH